MFTTEQKTLVEDTWPLIEPISNEAAALFYGKLFELDPSLKPLFKGDIREQGEKLMKTLGVAVASLNALPRLIPVLQGLGQRHVAYGVKPEHYSTVGHALLWALGKGLGERATPEAIDAWATVYRTVSSVMIEAAGSQR
jgi:hemoglobin-like flavoprotein